MCDITKRCVNHLYLCLENSVWRTMSFVCNMS